MPHPRTSLAFSLALLATTSGCATLVSASRHRDEAAVAKLLAGGADPNEVHEQTTPLCEAAKRGDARITEMLVEKGANVHGNCEEFPVVCAARTAAARVLLAHGADVNATCGFSRLLEYTMLHHDAERTALFVSSGAEVVSGPRNPLVKLANAFEPERPLGAENPDGAAVADAFLRAVRAKHGEERAKALIEDGVLSQAVLSANVSLVHVLLRHGASVDRLDALPIETDAEVSTLVRARMAEEYNEDAARKIATVLRCRGARFEVKSESGVTLRDVLAQWHAHMENRRDQHRAFLAAGRADREASARWKAEAEANNAANFRHFAERAGINVDPSAQPSMQAVDHDGVRERTNGAAAESPVQTPSSSGESAPARGSVAGPAKPWSPGSIEVGPPSGSPSGSPPPSPPSSSAPPPWAPPPKPRRRGRRRSSAQSTRSAARLAGFARLPARRPRRRWTARSSGCAS